MARPFRCTMKGKPRKRFESPAGCTRPLLAFTMRRYRNFDGFGSLDLQIALRHFSILQLMRVTFSDDPSLVHHVAALCKRQDHVEILFDEQNGRAKLVVDTADHSHDFEND